MKAFRDVERRLAGLERHATWRQEAAQREQRAWPSDDEVVAIMETMVEVGALPHPDAFADEDTWAAATVAEWSRLVTVFNQREGETL